MTKSRGFTFVEVLCALAIVSVVASAVAPLVAVCVRLSVGARDRSWAAAIAAAKLEQLRALTFTCDGAGQPVEDDVTDLSREPASSGGRGLQPSPSGTLEADTPGYVDYLDAAGAWAGTGPDAPGAAYLRRWNVRPLPANPENTRVLEVLVRPLAGGDAVRLVTAVTRKATGG